MNREVKFRAWDKDYKEMLQVKALISDPKCLIPDGERMEPYILDEHNDIHYLSDIELLEYTGCKDKNGEEIYEGDILMCDFYPYQGIYLVSWDKKDACFIAIDKKDGYVPAHVWDNCKIIGNKHENPELLEVEK